MPFRRDEFLGDIQVRGAVIALNGFRMNGFMADVEEKWLVSVFLYETNGLVCENVGDIPFRHIGFVPFKKDGIVGPSLSFHTYPVIISRAGSRTIPHMPLANMGRFVSVLLQVFREKVQHKAHLVPGRIVKDPMARWVLTREYARPVWGA
jgi:hypothetical protein